MSGEFKTVEGKQAAHAQDGEWLQPSENPFGHGCCRCSFYHDVSYRVVDKEGNIVEGYSIQLQFRLNPVETKRLEEFVASQKS